MSKVTITLEDQPNGTVKVVCDPTFESMAKAITGGFSRSDAYGMALRMANEILRMVKELRKGNKPDGLWLPKPKKFH